MNTWSRPILASVFFLAACSTTPPNPPGSVPAATGATIGDSTSPLIETPRAIPNSKPLPTSEAVGPVPTLRCDVPFAEWLLGQRLVYVSEVNSNPAIFVRGASGGAQHRISREQVSSIDPEFSSASGLVAYIYQESNQAFGLAVVRPDGSQYRSVTKRDLNVSLTSEPGNPDPNVLVSPLHADGWLLSWFEWSHAGDAVAVRTTDGQSNTLYVVNIDSGHRTPISSADDSLLGTSQSWSPSDEYIVYDTPIDSAGIRYRLFLASRDGSSISEIRTTGFSDRTPEWQSAGNLIAFVTASVSNFIRSSNLALVDRLGMDENVIVNAGHLVVSSLWSPDGRFLAFSVSELNDRGRTARSTINIIDVQTGETIEVASADDLSPWYFHWSADSRALAVLEGSGSQGTISVFDRCDSQTSVAVSDVYVSNFDWVPSR